jgi:HEAT repeat protein
MGTPKLHGKLSWILLPLLATGVQADELTRHVVYDRVQGELSPGTSAPTPERMVNAIRSASPTAMTALLEYGERVECMECVPLLHAKLLESNDARVREMAAWWLRRRPFGYGRVAASMRRVVMEDADPTRRARAAEALGEFLDVGGLPMLQHAANADGEVQVRLSAVRALGRLNARGGHAAVVAAMQDDEARVRLAALDQVTKLTFFEDHDAVATALRDTSLEVRRRAAQLAGHARIGAAAGELAALLRDDEDGAVRKAAAWALGRIGGSEAKAALRTAEASEDDDGVRDAIVIALQM